MLSPLVETGPYFNRMNPQTTTNLTESTSPSPWEKVSKKICHLWRNNSQEGETPTVHSRTTPNPCRPYPDRFLLP